MDFSCFFDAQQHIIIMPYVACIPPSMHSVGLAGAEPPVQYKYMMHALGLAGAEPRRPVTRHPAVLEGPLDDAHLPPATYTKKAGAKADDVRSGSGVPSWFLAEALDLA